MRDLFFISLVFCLGSVLALAGCASFSERGKNSVVAGIGKSYETRGDTSTHIPVLRVDVLAQCEDRTPESAIRDAVAVLDNSLGWVRAVTAIATSPERLGGEVVGEDRAEMIATLSLDYPQRHNVPEVINAWSNAVDNLNQQTQSCNLFMSK